MTTDAQRSGNDNCSSGSTRKFSGGSDGARRAASARTSAMASGSRRRRGPRSLRAAGRRGSGPSRSRRRQSGRPARCAAAGSGRRDRCRSGRTVRRESRDRSLLPRDVWRRRGYSSSPGGETVRRDAVMRCGSSSGARSVSANAAQSRRSPARRTAKRAPDDDPHRVHPRRHDARVRTRRRVQSPAGERRETLGEPCGTGSPPALAASARTPPDSRRSPHAERPNERRTTTRTASAQASEPRRPTRGQPASRQRHERRATSAMAAGVNASRSPVAPVCVTSSLWRATCRAALPVSQRRACTAESRAGHGARRC